MNTLIARTRYSILSTSMRPQCPLGPSLTFRFSFFSLVSHIRNFHNKSYTYKIVDLKKTDNGLNILWNDNHYSYFHYFWLRDCCRCPSCYHSEAEEKLLDLVGVSPSIKPQKLTINKEGNVDIVWDDHNNHKSSFNSEFLREHSKKSVVTSEPKEPYFIWGATDLTQMPEINYQTLSKKEGVLNWLNKLIKYGFVIIRNAPKQQGISTELAKLVAFPRRTFWGEDWSVKNTPNPQNLSLTSLELKCHTDFVWSEYVPGVQFLHCLKNAGNMGGETILVDGYKVAQVLKEQDPVAFELLSTYPVPWYFKTKELDYTYKGCVIELDKDGDVKCLRYNQANRAPLDGPSHLIPAMYRALQKFAELVRSSSLTQVFLLHPGDVLVFNNRRALHGRTAFDSRAERFLEGCYLDLEEVMCKRAVLTKQLSSTNSYSEVISKPDIKPKIPFSINISTPNFGTGHMHSSTSVPFMFSSASSGSTRQARNFSSISNK